jgi:hypothetical protein
MVLINRAEVVVGLLKIHTNMYKAWHEKMGVTNLIRIIYNFTYVRGSSTGFLPPRN